MQTLEAKRFAHDRKLLDEAIHLPQRFVGRAVRSSTTELVVENDGAAVGEGGELFQVVVRKARAAVQTEKRHAGAVADGSVPDSTARDVDVALALRARDCRSSPTTRGAQIAPPGVEECPGENNLISGLVTEAAREDSAAVSVTSQNLLARNLRRSTWRRGG